jgi:hypothetical protein
MNITFKRVDAAYVAVEQIRIDIADVIYKNPYFTEIACDILLSIFKLHNQITKELQDEFELRKYKVDSKDLPAYQQLQELFIKYYIMIQDFEFDNQLYSHNPREYKYYGLSSNERKLDVFRGVLFEAIVEAFVKGRYTKDKFNTGCIIRINNHDVEVYYGNGRRKKTIDIAGWKDHEKCGEFYECKIRPSSFKEENYKYLNRLENILLFRNVKNYVVAFASADSQEYVESKIKEIQSTVTYKPKKIQLYGRDRLINLIDFTFPITA